MKHASLTINSGMCSAFVSFGRRPVFIRWPTVTAFVMRRKHKEFWQQLKHKTKYKQANWTIHYDNTVIKYNQHLQLCLSTGQQCQLLVWHTQIIWTTLGTQTKYKQINRTTHYDNTLKNMTTLKGKVQAKLTTVLSAGQQWRLLVRGGNTNNPDNNTWNTNKIQTDNLNNTFR